MSKNCDFDANVHIYVFPKKGFTKKGSPSTFTSGARTKASSSTASKTASISSLYTPAWQKVTE